jgi:CRP-like cAMP-binding protein
MLGVFMRKIVDNSLLEHYIKKHNIDQIFDEDMLKYAQLYFFEKGEYILEAANKLEYYYLLVGGKIKIYYILENGKYSNLKFYNDFVTIGDMELLKDDPIICNIDAVEDTYMIVLSSDILRKKYFDNPKFLRHLVDSLSVKLSATINNSSYNFVYPLINRLASYLVEHTTDEEYIILTSSYLEIAEFLGTTYRHLNRTFKEMEAKSIIKCEDKRINILDNKRLRELSKNLFINPL